MSKVNTTVVDVEEVDVEILSDDEINNLLALDSDEEILAALCDSTWTGKKGSKLPAAETEFDFDEMNHQSYGRGNYGEDISDYY